MTTEQREYGYGWVKCARCGVHDAIGKKTYDRTAKVYWCTDTAQCDRWIADLADRGLVAGVDLDFATGPRPTAGK